MRVNKVGTLDILSGYSGSKDIITDMKVKGNTIYIGQGAKGISTYDYSSS